MKQYRNILASLIVATAFLFVFSGSAAAETQNGTCEDVSLPVAIASGKPANKHIVGQFCVPNEWADGEQRLDVLVHGGSYNRTYWDWPQQYPDYSYVDRTLAAGRATFAYDRLGVGESSRPTGALVTTDADAFSLHQIIQHWRGQGYSDITAISHSLGSMILTANAEKYRSADRIVVTGLLHGVGADLPAAMTGFYPAMLDQQFFGAILDPTYVTTQPGTRSQILYSQSADPTIQTYDEAHKDVMSVAQFAEASDHLTPPLFGGKNIDVPVFVIDGQEDGLFCGLLLDCSNPAAVEANEAQYYSNAPSLTVELVPDTGHNLTLHPSADESFTVINSWIEAHQ